MSDNHQVVVTLADEFHREYTELAALLGLTPTEAMQYTLEGGSYVMRLLIRHFRDNPDLIEEEGRLEGFVGKAVFMELSDCVSKIEWHSAHRPSPAADGGAAGR
jgi:hypothetical protein